ncbi:3'-5' exonuclease [Paenibacillus glucanolyticus]|uniref:Exonuclease domain-containing protein n=1 Tax=Paenibacillus glucanolyticus TaxID=59843 RepID=A0A163GT04_9BACL|nr:3'-5' exonuclease [Paenibacillus glucanolyticus]KZS45131.1 hypothetical protein AWU65_03880 [Paenibacillus glucanolyticus]OMF65144.1 hypothetical protein BK142_31165 [Paenibacillus glucanolyticus]
MKVLLAIELYQYERYISAAMYCEIQGIKNGYLYYNQSTSNPVKAFGQCILAAIQVIVKSYNNRSLILAFPEAYLSILHPQIKSEIYRVLDKFESFEFTNDRYLEVLSIVNQMGEIDSIDQCILHGYSSTEVEMRRNQLNEEKLRKKKRDRPQDYNGVLMPLSGVVIDFETNSTHVKYARIFEVGAIKFKNGVIIDRFQSFTNPGIKIPKAIRELTGIRQIDIDTAPTTYTVMKKLINFIGDTKVLVGHNLYSYDYELLRLFSQRFRMPSWNGQLLCTMKFARKSQIIVKDYKLETLCRLFNITSGSAHRALNDCESTFELLKALYNHTLLGKQDPIA